MPETVTIQMKPAGLFQQVVTNLPASHPLSRLGTIHRIYIRDVGLRELHNNSSHQYLAQAVYMEHWDGVSAPLDIGVILAGQAGALNRGRVRFRYTDEVARSLDTGLLAKLIAAGLFVNEGFDLAVDTLDGIATDQFVLRDGSRSFTGTIAGITPTAPVHLVTKQYVDALVGGGGGDKPLLVHFDYTTASPLALTTLDPGDLIDEVEVTVEVPFDDPAAALQLGTVAAPALLFGPADIDPLMDCQYHNALNIEMAVAEVLQLQIAPGASTQGAGFVLVKIRKP